MKVDRCVLLPLLVSEALLSFVFGCGGARKTAASPPPQPLVPEVFSPLQQDLQKPYLELFRIAPTLEYSEAQIQKMRDYLNQAQSYCVTSFKQRTEQHKTELAAAQADLQKRTASMAEAERHQIHCRIQNLRISGSEADVLANHAIPIAYENKLAKLELIEKWPGQLKEIKQELASGAYKSRRWGNVEAIGQRVIAAGQEDDIKTGEEAVKQMKQANILPPVIEDKTIADYVNTVAQRVARLSDLKVPLHVTVLDSKEINAFALPGGFLFVERGLLEAAEDEGQLAGVLGHEIGHDVARHGHKLMVRATIASIFYQAAQVAASVLTGGAAGIGAYYALQYGFYGLGLVLNLDLLGVSRDFELEADQLGIQYTWNTGYDPSGFIRFFDKMATKEGYVNGVGFFRSHPPFYQRMVDAEREIMFLPKKGQPIENTAEFQQMKKALAPIAAKAKAEEKASNPLVREQGCQAPAKLEYTPDRPIETICSGPGKLP